MSNNKKGNLQLATFGGGCFWCTEAIFLNLKGVESVVSGYTGGFLKNPTYNDICTGTTGHAEVIQIEFNEEVVSYSQLLEVFFATHDPTTLNQQGADRGTQYRSEIFAHSDTQKQEAYRVIQSLTSNKIYDRPIVTKVSMIGTFFVAESHHQNYYYRNTNQGYCRAVITPKVEKFEKVFVELLKDN